MKEKNSSGIIGTAVPRYMERGEMFYREITKINGKKLLWTVLHIGGFMFVASILFLLVMLITTS